DRRPGKCRPVVSIDRDRLIEQSQSLENPLFRYRKEDRKRAQVEIVGAQVGGRSRARLPRRAACEGPLGRRAPLRACARSPPPAPPRPPGAPALREGPRNPL